MRWFRRLSGGQLGAGTYRQQLVTVLRECLHQLGDDDGLRHAILFGNSWYIFPERKNNATHCFFLQKKQV